MKNVLKEAQLVLAYSGSPYRIGVIQSKNRDGGYNVESSTGAIEIVYGTAAVGETVLYKDKKIEQRLRTPTVSTYYIK